MVTRSLFALALAVVGACEVHQELGTVGDAGAAPAPATATQSIEPAFLPLDGGPPWSVDLGESCNPDLTGTNAGGTTAYVPVSLPDGAVVVALAAFGSVYVPGTKAYVTLIAEDLAASAGQTVIELDLTAAGNPFELSASPGDAAFVVDNALDRYAITVGVLAQQADAVCIHSLAISYTMGSGTAQPIP